MLHLLFMVAPIFILIALGFLMVQWRFVPREWLPALGGFVYRIALPALIYKSLSQRAFAGVMNLNYLGAYAFGSLLVLGGALIWSRYVRRQSLERAALTGIGMACANSSFVGYPIALQVVGAGATTALALCMIVENVVVLPLGIALADTGSASHEPFTQAMGRALLRLRRNPIVIAIALGIASSALHVHLAAPLVRSVDMLAGASAPVALFFVGGTLVGLPMRDQFVEVYATSFGKLVLHPLAVGAGVWLFGPADPALRLAAVVIACAPMLSIYPILGARHGMQGFCAATLLVATIASFITISVALWLLQPEHGLLGQVLKGPLATKEHGVVWVPGAVHPGLLGCAQSGSVAVRLAESAL